MNESVKKSGRKPIGREAMTPAQRKREQRLSALTRVMECDYHEWTETDCIMVLQMAKFKNTLMAKDAYEQLGRLRFSDCHEK